jgi:putative PIN family toxin of toxin-antitoxin system
VRAVVDTNVVVSRFLSLSGNPALILALWEKGLFELVLTEAILAEYERVLAYDQVRSRHGMHAEEIGQIIADFRTFAVMIEPGEAIDVIADDPSDNRFLEAVSTSSAATHTCSGSGNFGASRSLLRLHSCRSWSSSNRLAWQIRADCHRPL